MKVGILTYHRSHNFGALLQAIATRVLFERQGHQVQYIDYWPEYQQSMYQVFDSYRWKKSSLRGKLRQLREYINLRQYKLERIAAFDSFIKSYIRPYCAPYGNNDVYDMVLYGSDQIWRKQERMSHLFNPVYFAHNNIKTKQHVAWAASMGIIQLSAQDESFLMTHLAHFDALSVRERSLHDTLQRLGIASDVILDPTIMLSAHDWQQVIPESGQRLIPEPYILYYPLVSGLDETTVRRYAEQRHLRFITLCASVQKKPMPDVWTATSPSHMISLVKYAEAVFTSSFHGMVFSIIHHKPFMASFAVNVQRAESLLDDLNLRDHLLEPSAAICDIPAIDYNAVESRLELLRSRTQNFVSRIMTINTAC